MSNQNLHAQNWLFLLEKRIKSFIAKILCLSILALVCFSAPAQKQCDQIKLNQVGYYPNSLKYAFVTCNFRADYFYVVSANGSDTMYVGALSLRKKSTYSSTTTRTADFSTFTTPGNYVLRIADKESFPFEIKNDVYTDLGKAVLKSFYYQRSSIPLENKYAGKWNRSAKHSGDVVVIKPSSFSDDRGKFISSPGGWYDKGDFNKYIVASGITMNTLLSAYEDFTNYFDTLRINIPESNDKIPDVLNEVLYNLRWMFTMQDPYDGGVYYKCINAKFEDIALHGVSDKSETVKKSTAAALDFAAVMSQAGRILRRMKGLLPGLSDSCLRASANAWVWALKHPNVEYDQPVEDKGFRPAASITSGDRQLNDEWLWAATEMFVTSRNRMYFDVIEQNVDDSISLPTLNNVGMLAYYTMLRYSENLPAYTSDITKLMRDRLVALADNYLSGIPATAFSTVMGQSKNDFTRGSNAIAANQGVLLINAYLVTGNEKYVAASMSNLDYLLGRNATGYCFVTGCFGIKSPVHPYYRISALNGEPIPGLLVAGPCGSREKSLFISPDIETLYRDSDSDYETNQISLDWNSSMVYLVNAVEAMQYALGFSSKVESTIASSH